MAKDADRYFTAKKAWNAALKEMEKLAIPSYQPAIIVKKADYDLLKTKPNQVIQKR